MVFGALLVGDDGVARAGMFGHVEGLPRPLRCRIDERREVLPDQSRRRRSCQRRRPRSRPSDPAGTSRDRTASAVRAARFRSPTGCRSGVGPRSAIPPAARGATSRRCVRWRRGCGAIRRGRWGAGARWPRVRRARRPPSLRARSAPCRGCPARSVGTRSVYCVSSKLVSAFASPPMLRPSDDRKASMLCPGKCFEPWNCMCSTKCARPRWSSSSSTDPALTTSRSSTSRAGFGFGRM